MFKECDASVQSARHEMSNRTICNTRNVADKLLSFLISVFYILHKISHAIRYTTFKMAI